METIACCFTSEKTPYCAFRRLGQLPMCEKHMYESIRDAIFDNLLPSDVMRQLIVDTDWIIDIKRLQNSFEMHKDRKALEREREAAKTLPGVVYYVRLTGDRIKIGTSRELKRRLASMRVRPADLLAVEPGDVERERERHDQFRHLRQGRLEEFTTSPELEAHIEDVRQSWGHPMMVPGVR